MSKAKEFIKIMENFLNEAIKKGSKLKLLIDIESKDGNTIPKNSIVDVISIEKKGGKTIISVEAIDGEVANVELLKNKKEPFKQIR